MNKPSFKNLKQYATKKNAKRLGLFVLTAATLTNGGLLYNYSGPNKFTLKSTLGKVADKTGTSGMDVHIPLIQYVHDYHREVQTIEFNAGGDRFFPFGANTSDQNHLNADLKLNYRVLEDAQKLGYHPWAMDGFIMQDGYWLLTDMMNQSTNAVMGKRTLAETESDPKRFNEEFYEDLTFRLEQNNVPVAIESTELVKFKTFGPTKTVSYQQMVNPKQAPPQP